VSGATAHCRRSSNYSRSMTWAATPSSGPSKSSATRAWSSLSPAAGPTSAATSSSGGFPCPLGDHLGTTRHTSGRTTRRWPPVMCGRLNVSELRRRLLPRPGGQGVAGSNPAVPTDSRAFSKSYVSQEPTKEPSCCAMALLETCADRVPRCPARACANTAEPRSARPVAQLVRQCVHLAPRGGEVGNGDADVLAGGVAVGATGAVAHSR
jgi:hypothetical protein